MGDRANICVQDSYGPAPIYMYTHWEGTKLPETLKSALINGKDRWDDPIYLSRIIFSYMIKDNILGDIGFGLSTKVGDGDDKIIYVNMDKKTVSIRDVIWTFAEYIQQDFKKFKVW